MADEKQVLGAADNNAEVAAKLAAQGLESPTPKPEEIQESSDALDALAKQVVEKKSAPATPTPTPTPPAADPPATPPAEEPPASTPEELAKKQEAEAAQKKQDEERAAAAKRSEELFKDVPSLPPGASPKSSEAFATIKIKAAQEITAREQQLEETRKKLAEAEAKLQAGPDPAITKELEELRQWRAKLDVDADPRFNEFDKTAEASREFIYAQLKKSPAVTPETIEQIKKLGGPENVNLEKLFAAIKDPTLQRIVESKVADIEMAKFNKDQAIKAAKDNISEYIDKQRQQYRQNVDAHNERTKQHLGQYTTKLSWYAEKQVDPKADEPTRKAAEAHNAFVKEVKTQIEGALRDDSPEMRAIMLTGMAQLLYLQKVHAATQQELEAVKKSLAEATKNLERFTKASVSRLDETAAPPGGKIDTKPKGVDFTTSAGDALDNIAKQVMEERAKKAAA